MFAFGSIDLGSGGYVTGPGGSSKPATFGNSSIAYNNVTHTDDHARRGLQCGGNLNQVTKLALTLTLSTSIADIAGNAVSGSPFTTAFVQQF